jgi:hypothetical protein
MTLHSRVVVGERAALEVKRPHVNPREWAGGLVAPSWQATGSTLTFNHPTFKQPTTLHVCAPLLLPRLSVRRAIAFFLENLQRQLEREETLGVRTRARTRTHARAAACSAAVHRPNAPPAAESGLPSVHPCWPHRFPSVPPPLASSGLHSDFGGSTPGPSRLGAIALEPALLAHAQQTLLDADMRLILRCPCCPLYRPLARTSSPSPWTAHSGSR